MEKDAGDIVAAGGWKTRRGRAPVGKPVLSRAQIIAARIALGEKEPADFIIQNRDGTIESKRPHNMPPSPRNND